ncbi:MAG: sigma-54 dependent transcriptional regulator [Acidobacteriota bacterium]|nr:sigma-54 dependent transcriptional regulator [Blastocatellia bacterium]MDW8412286.1 sigma-54 dependent transcriptional regulator [Acidobacteriota bacterium]
MRRPKVTIVDDEAGSRQGLSELLSTWGYETTTAVDGAEAFQLIQQVKPDVVITDVIMPKLDGFGLLRELRDIYDVAVIILTGQGNIEMALRALQEEGAFYYLEKPVDPVKLKVVLAKAVEYWSTRRENRTLKRQLQDYGVFGKLVGQSQPMRELYTLLEQVAPSSVSVLITGESGTGKELVSRTIHEMSPRRNCPFVAINCSAIPESLMESELFGHEKGAFTGAAERRIGCFELAHTGTILLDEIAEMPPSLQAKLLRVLEERRVRRLGAAREIPVDVRVIAATNKDPMEAVRKGILRDDLLYRLNVINIKLPPLRERADDIPLIARHLVEELARKHSRRVRLIAPEALEVMMKYSWPGNVRELRNVLERAVIICEDEQIQKRHLPPQLFGDEPVTRKDVLTLPIGSSLDEIERQVILHTLIKVDNNKTRAAEILQISLKTLHNKLKLYRENKEQ